jgi:hypothetical protein
MGDDGSAVNPYDRQIFTAPGSHKDDGHDYGHGAVGARRHNKDGTVVEHKLIGQHPDIPLRDETPPPLLG